MTRDEFLQDFARCLQQDTCQLTGEEQLDSLPGWDSLAVVIFMAQLDKTYRANVPPAKIKQAQTVNELYAIVIHLTNDAMSQA